MSALFPRFTDKCVTEQSEQSYFHIYYSYKKRQNSQSD